ncbi:MAG: hypothetical protein WD852_06140 [Methyloceanibacter sp.]
MRKIAVVLLFTVLAVLVARIAHDSAAIQTAAPLNPPLMYAGIRG